MVEFAYDVFGSRGLTLPRPPRKEVRVQSSSGTPATPPGRLGEPQCILMIFIVIIESNHLVLCT